MPPVMPTFLNPLAALIAAAVAVPLLLALYFLKLRRTERPVASTLLWRKAIQDLQVNSPFQKLRRNLLLLLQLLLLLALLLALSRPVSSHRPVAGDSTVLMIDRSASMGASDVDGHSRLAEAKARAKALVDTMTRGDKAMVVAFDDTAETVQAFTTDTAALKNAIDRIGPTDRLTKLQTAYKLADAQLQFDVDQLRPNESNDVYLFSDGRVSDAAELNLRGKLKYEEIGSDRAKNVAIVAFSAKRNYERPTEVQVFARLANYGPDVAEAPVQLSVGEIDPNDPAAVKLTVRRTDAAVTLPPARWTPEERAAAEKKGFAAKESVEFTLDLPVGAVLQVEQMNKEGDALPADDKALIVLPPPKPLSVLLVTDGNPFVERMVLDSLDLRDPKEMTPAEYEAAVPTSFDVIIFDGYSPKKLPPSGNFVYFGGVAKGLKLKQAEADGQPLFMADNLVLDWEREHPILRGLSLDKLYAKQAIRLDVPLDAKTLVEGLKGPLVVLYREGRRRHLVVAFNTLDSNWPLRQSFPYFMYNALQYMAAGEDLQARQSYQPGATVRIPRLDLQKLPGNAAEVRQIRLNGPDKSQLLTVPKDGEFVLPALDFVGLYGTDPAVPQYEHFAANLLDENESNLMPSAKAPGGIGERTAAAGSAESRLEWWWWLVAAVGLPLLMIEWWVYTRRVHL